jgi:hypothetical protein
MDHYEELGLPPSASTEEIRQAYKSLARLLHPDQQQDENLRRVAECQMKRLNSVIDVLTDPELRRQYDLGAVRKPPPRHALVVWLNSRSWVIAVVLAFLAVALFLRCHPSKAPAVPLSSLPPAVEARRPVLKHPERVTPAPARRTVKLEPHPQQLEPADGLPEPRSHELSEPPPVEETAQPPPPEVAFSLPAVGPPPSGFGGTWSWEPNKTGSSVKALYPPEFIEAVIVEQAGVLHGRYRARYKVADRPISPDVQFQFQGSAGVDSAALRWAGDGGASGEVRLTLLSANAMRVTWSATTLGTGLGLSAGTAVLTRRE